MLLVFFRTNWLSLTDSSGTRANVTPQRHATAAHCSFSARLLPCCADQEVRQPGPLLEVILARPARTAHANRFLHSPHPSPTTGGIHHQLFPLSKTSAPSRTTDMAPSQKLRSILRNTLHCCVFCFPFSFGEQVFDLFFVCFRPFSNKKKARDDIDESMALIAKSSRDEQHKLKKETVWQETGKKTTKLAVFVFF